jgi:hypothetical protein
MFLDETSTVCSISQKKSKMQDIAYNLSVKKLLGIITLIIKCLLQKESSQINLIHNIKTIKNFNRNSNKRGFIKKYEDLVLLARQGEIANL